MDLRKKNIAGVHLETKQQHWHNLHKKRQSSYF